MNFSKQKQFLIVFSFIFLQVVIAQQQQCEYRQVLDFNKTDCINEEVCYEKGGINNKGQCVQSCADGEFIQISTEKNRKNCSNSCEKSSFKQSDNPKICIDSCKKGEIKDKVNKQCLKSKEDCKFFINRNYCVETCEGDYLIPQKVGNVNICQYCIGYLIKEKSGPTQCVNKCPITHPFIKRVYNDIYTHEYQCVSECQENIKSDNQDQYCSKDKCNAFNLERNVKINGINQCVKTCPPQKQYEQYGHDSLFCSETCNGIKSSNNKYCLQACDDFNEVEENGRCIQCKIGQKYDEKAGKYVCAQDNNDIQTAMQMYKNNDIFHLNSIDELEYFKQLIQMILSRLEQYNLIKDRFREFTSRISYLGFNPYFQNQPPLVFQTNTLKYIFQIIHVQTKKDYKTSFTLSKLNSDNPDNLTIPSQTQYRNQDFFPYQLGFLISKKNFLCDDNSPNQCIKDNEVIVALYDSGEFKVDEERLQLTLFYDNVDNSKLNKYKCLTTKDGIMQLSLKTEVINNPTGIKCTFKDNISLFLDTMGLFDEKKCEQDKPYKLNDKCVEKCPQLNDPLRMVCVQKIEECSYITEDGKECVAQCSNDYPYKFKSSDTQTVCQKSCTSTQISNKEERVCLKDINECKQFLIDDKFCSSSCPDDKFKYKTQKSPTPYQLCNTQCEFILNENSQQKYCQQECNQDSIFATVDEKGNHQKYCNSCPPESPFKNKSENFTNCSSKCKEGEITHSDQKVCLLKKQDCKEYLINEKTCSKECKKEFYLFTEEKTPYKSCKTDCGELFSYQRGEYKVCSSSCFSSHIVDKEAKKCYNEKKECPKYISLNGKECNSKCGEETDYQYIQAMDGYKQCRICRNIIKQKNNVNECVKECNTDEMIFQFNNKDRLRLCVSKNFCENKMKSAKDSNLCSDKCIKPEKNSDNNKCLEVCPLFYSPQDNNCIDKCDKDSFYTSDEKLCVESCEKVFEIVDETNAKNKCKKCANNEYQSKRDDGKIICKPINNTDENLQSMRKDLDDKFKKMTIQSVQESRAAQQVINLYATLIENKLSKTTGESQQDLVSAKSAFTSILDMTKTFLDKVDNQIKEQPVKIITKEFIVTSQAEQPGKKFKTVFNSNEMESGSSSLLETDPDESSTTFVPSILQASYLKKGYFCADSQCKEFPPLFVVTYEPPKIRRMLAETTPQTFEISYKISEDQEPEKFQCLSYSKEGKLDRLQGQINNNEIKCNFEYSSALFYDKNCEFVQSCQSSNLKDQDDDKLSGGAIAGIVIGIIVFLALIIFSIVYFKRKSRRQPQKAYQASEQQDKVLTIYDNKVIESYNDFEKLPKNK